MSDARSTLCGMEMKFHGETCTTGGSFDAPIVSARASTRDASMWERPDTRKIKQYHIRWHGGIFSACKATLILCDESIPSADVPAGLRCRRRGCKESWPNVPAQRPPDTDV